MDPLLTSAYGFTDSDLEKINTVVIVGDQFVYRSAIEQTSLFDVATRGSYDDRGAHWYSTEDGQEIGRQTYDDLSFLLLMPNLTRLEIAMADLKNMPSLKTLKKLESVWISDCVLEDLKWLDGSSISTFMFNSCGTQDFSPLSACEKLRNVQIDFFACRGAELSGFAPPNLKKLSLQNGHDIQTPDLNALSTCEKLEEIEFQYMNIRDLEFLRGKKMMNGVSLDNVNGLSDLSPVGELKNLYMCRIRNCNAIRDYSPLGGCDGLVHLDLACEWESRVRDAAWLSNLTNMTDYGFYGCELPNFDFLDSIPESREINFGFSGSIGDYSALGRHQNFGYLHLNPSSHNYADVADAIQDKQVGYLVLYEMNNIDLSRLPKILNRLEIVGGKLENLHGMPEQNFKVLALQNMQRITTLEGIENLKYFREGNGDFSLEIYGCPRLTDLSALDGKNLGGLELHGVYTMPDLSKVGMTDLVLDYVEGLEDMTCLETIDPVNKLGKLSIFMPDHVNNLLPAAKLKGGQLIVSPQFGEQAQALVDAGNFRSMEINYPDHSWQQNSNGFTLLNLEELDILPPKLLAKVDNVTLVGDQVVDMDQTDVWQEWDPQQNKGILKLRDRATGEESYAMPGSLTDLTRLSPLTGLKRLNISCQAIENLNGIDGMLDLEEVRIQECDRLTDVSVLFTLENLHRIEIRNSPVESIQGIQNLTQLVEVTLGNTEIKDMSPLEEMDTGFADQQGGLNLMISGSSFLSENANDLNNMSDRLLSFVDSLCIIGDKIYSFDRYDVWGQMNGKKVDLILQDNQKQEQTPLDVSGIEEVDLSFLSRMPNLKRLHLFAMQITDLQPLQGLNQLTDLQLKFCDKLEDISAVSGMQELENLFLDFTGIKSIEAVAGLKKLKDLSLNQVEVTDLSPLSQCDFSFADQNGGLSLWYGNQKMKDWSFLEGIRNINWLGLGGTDAKPVVEHLKGTKIRGIMIWFKDQKVFDQFLDEHPEIEEMNISFNQKITDLSRLTEMRNLRRVQISNDMKKAIKSLEGKEYSFQLDIQN